MGHNCDCLEILLFLPSFFLTSVVSCRSIYVALFFRRCALTYCPNLALCCLGLSGPLIASGTRIIYASGPWSNCFGAGAFYQTWAVGSPASDERRVPCMLSTETFSRHVATDQDDGKFLLFSSNICAPLMLSGESKLRSTTHETTSFFTLPAMHRIATFLSHTLNILKHVLQLI